MVEPPKPPTFSAPVHSSQHTTAARDLVTQVSGMSKEVPIGSLLEGKVVSQTSSGLTTLKTAHGEITFQTQIGLLKGSLVTLRVTATSSDFQARLVTINGQTLLEYLGTQPSTGQSGRVSSSFTLPQDQILNQSAGQSPEGRALQPNLSQAGNATLERGDTVLQRNAVLQTALLSADGKGVQKFLEILPPQAQEQLLVTIQAAASKQNIPVTTTDLQSLITRTGNVIEFRVVSYQLPATTAAATATTNTSGNATATQTNAGTGTPPSTTAPNIPASGSTVTPTTPQATPASGQPTPNAAFQTPIATTQTTQNTNVNLPTIGPDQIVTDPKTGNIRFQAVVIGQEANQQATIKTPLGIFHTNNALPKGAVLELEFTNITYVSATGGFTPSLGAYNPTAQDAISKLLNFWKLFASSDTAKTFTDLGRMDAFQTRLPNADTDLGANLLRYLSAMNKQSSSELLGQTLASRLERMGRGQEAMEQLARDLGLNRQLLSQTQQDDWRTLIFPVVSDNTWYANRLLYKEYEGKNQQGEPERGVRFVIELDMEKLGALQLDGLVRKTGDTQFFDLTIRSQQPIPKSARDGIFAIFLEAQEEFDIEGRLIFQLTPQLPDIIKETSASSPDGGDGGSIVV